MKKNIKPKINEETNINRKKFNTKKLILQTVIVIFSLALLLVTLVTLACTVKASNLAIGKTKFYIMRAQSEPEIAKDGDLVIVKELERGQVQVGDYVVYDNGENFYCDNVVQVKQTNIGNKLIVAEKNGVSYQFNETEVEGKIVKSIPVLGNIITFLRTPLGGIFYIIFVGCIFCLITIALFNKGAKQKEQKHPYNGK